MHKFPPSRPKFEHPPKLFCREQAQFKSIRRTDGIAVVISVFFADCFQQEIFSSSAVRMVRALAILFPFGPIQFTWAFVLIRSAIFLQASKTVA